MELFRLKGFFTVILIHLCVAAGVVSAADSISPAELNDRIAKNKAPFILDVRTPEEFAQGHVPGAVNIPVSEIADRSSELAGYKEKEIVVYCAAGPRASFARSLMSQLGFTGTKELQGHMMGWTADGYPVEKAQ